MSKRREGTMGLITGIVKRLVKFIVYFIIFAAIVILIPNLPPYADFTSIKFEATQPRDGALTPNTALNNIKKLYLNKVHGPEAFAIFNGDLYTGMATGEVVKISPGGHVTFVTKIGKPCVGEWQEHICGRPLGLDINEKDKQLYVADAYYGIWKVDLKTDKKQLLVSPTVEIEKRVPKIFNDIVLTKNGDFYWTESSSDFKLQDGVYTMLADPTGRLHYYNAAKNQSKVLVDGLWFANGVVISPDNQYIVVAETIGYSLHRYYIDGPKKGQKDIFIQGLPGTPDNIQVLPDGSGILVGLYTIFDDQHPLLIKSMAPVPLVRKFLARILKLIEAPFEFANTVYPHHFFQYATFMIGNFGIMSCLAPPMSGFLHIDWNGKINGLYMNTDLSLSSVSDAIVFNDMLYIGSPHNHFIGAVPAPENLKNAFNIRKTVPVKTAETVTEKIPVKKTDSKPVEQKPINIKEDPVKKVQETEQRANLNQQPKEVPTEQKPSEPVKPTEQPKSKTPASTTPKAQVEQKPTAKIPNEPVDKVSSQPQTVTPTPKPQPKETKPKEKSTTTSPGPQTTTPTPKSTPPSESKLKHSEDVEKRTKDPKIVEPKVKEKKVEPEIQTTAPKSTPPIETKPKSKQNENVEKRTEDHNVVQSELKQKKIEPETKQTDKSKTNAKKETLKNVKNSDKNDQAHKAVPEQIPIKEEIPSEKIKPDPAKFKVITRDGPTEIPVLNI